MTARRAFLQWLGAAPVAATVPTWARSADSSAGGPVSAQAVRREAIGRGHVRLQDDRVSIQFDEQMRSRLVRLGGPRPLLLTGFDAGETLLLDGGKAVDRFTLTAAHPGEVNATWGPGQQLVVTGRSATGIEKAVTVTLLDQHPGVLLIHTVFTNTGTTPLAVQGWTVGAHRLLAAPRHGGGWWTYSGATHQDRRDWMQPVKRGFDQRNFMGMNASDYGGGTPVVDVWRRDLGVALGHLDRVPRLVSLPVRAVGDQVDLALRCDEPMSLVPGATLATPTAFLHLHDGDCFVPLDRYRQLMQAQGLAAPEPPRSAHDAVWCAWGYERDFSLDYVRATLPKVQELGLKWAVLDDGWQRATGDWTLDLAKFPGGDADIKALVNEIHARGMKARLWIAPLAVAPGSDELHEHADLLLLDKDGAPQLVSWWNSFYLCPAHPQTQARIAAIFRKIIGDWGFDGLKIDGQHLNGVAPCYNPKHRHARPEDAVEQMAAFYRTMFEAAHAVNPEAVVEVCPCGTSYAFHNMPFIDQAPASDPLSSWQVRHKGKALKAQMGRWSAYAGDHVELSTGGQDFASAVGVGAVVSTKFTWPVDPKPKDSFLLTPEREAHWRRYISAHNAKGLSDGTYRGELYDIAFDLPETHVVEKNGVMHYAFYAPRWDGPVTLRGLGPGTWRLRDYVNQRDLGTVQGARPTLTLRFEEHLLIEATLVSQDPRPVVRSARVPARWLDREGFPVATAWSDAPASFFAHDWLGRPLVGAQSTRVQLLHDDRMLYLRFISRYQQLATHERALSATDLYPLWERDVVEVFVQAPQDAGTSRYRELQVAPNGLMQEIEIGETKRQRVRDQSRARASVQAEQRLWTAELAVPWRSVSGGPASGAAAHGGGSASMAEGWRLNFFRIEGPAGGRMYSAWNPTGTEKPNFHVPEAFGQLKFS